MKSVDRELAQITKSSFSGKEKKETTTDLVENMGKIGSCIILLLLSIISLFVKAQSDLSLTKYKNHIENYIMRGYGQGWKNCDVIQVASESLGRDVGDEVPTLVTTTSISCILST